MTDERRLQIDQGIKLLLIAVCAMLYAWGGIEHKELRRFVAPGLVMAGAFYFTRDWRSLVMGPLFILASCLGYGADETWIKVLKRSYVGLAFVLAASSYHIWRIVQFKEKKRWIPVGFSFLILPCYVILGVYNPVQARIEETALGLADYAAALMFLSRR